MKIFICALFNLSKMSAMIITESVMITDVFLPTYKYSYDKAYIYLRWFLDKHCMSLKGKLRQKKKEGGVEGNAGF